MERRLFRHVFDAVQKLFGAGPADFDAAEQIGLRARHLEHALGLEMRLGAENFRVRPEAHFGAAAVRRLAGVLQFALRLAALERHAVKLLAARDLDLHALGQRVGHRYADAVQAARGLVDLGIEFAAGVQRAHDHFERGLVLEFRMRIDRHAAAIVGDGDEAVGRHLDLDPVGVAGERLVHGVVDHLGEQVMQRLLVGAADIHAGPPPHRLEPLQHLDVLCRIAGLRRAARRARAAPGGAAARRFHLGEKVGRLRGFRCLSHTLRYPSSAADGFRPRANHLPTMPRGHETKNAWRPGTGVRQPRTLDGAFREVIQTYRLMGRHERRHGTINSCRPGRTAAWCGLRKRFPSAATPCRFLRRSHLPTARFCRSRPTYFSYPWRWCDRSRFGRSP